MSMRAVVWPAPSGCDSATMTLKCLVLAAVRKRATSTREYPWVRTTAPSSISGAPSCAICVRASRLVRAKVSPRSTSSRFTASKSVRSSICIWMRVTKRTKSSHNDPIEMGASGQLFSTSPACLSSSRRPIIVVAVERRMSSVSAMMAEVADDLSVSSR